MSLINLITGIGGFVASHLMDYLLSQGEIVYGTYRWNEDLSRIIPLKDRIKMIPMDLIDLPSCMRCIKENHIDYIYHLAAQSYVDDSFIYPVQTIMTNTIGTLNLLEAVRICDVKPLIHVCSSSECYGQVNEDEIPIKESNPFRPQNPYAVSKAGADMIAYMYWRCYKIPIIRTRMFTHTGVGRTMLSAEVSFAQQIARIEKGAEPIVKVGNLDSVRTVADVRDAVRAYYLLLRKCPAGEVYNIGGDKTIKIGDMLNYLISLSPMKDRIKVEVDPLRMRPSDVTLQIPDTSEFRKITGWKPEISFEQTMYDLLNYWREMV